MRGFGGFADPSQAVETAAASGGRQPNTVGLGAYTGAPLRTTLATVLVTPALDAAGNQLPPTLVVPATRENRFVTFLAPSTGPIIYIGESGVNTNSGFALPPGQPWEVPLVGNQALYAVNNGPTTIGLGVQIAPALAGDTERRL